MFATMQDPHVPEFINRLDDAQKKATRAYLPTTNDWLDDMATSSLLLENSFPNDCPAGTVSSPLSRLGRLGKSSPPPSIVQ